MMSGHEMGDQVERIRGIHHLNESVCEHTRRKVPFIDYIVTPASGCPFKPQDDVGPMY